jgi:hypothetical protein
MELNDTNVYEPQIRALFENTFGRRFGVKGLSGDGCHPSRDLGGKGLSRRIGLLVLRKICTNCEAVPRRVRI